MLHRTHSKDFNKFFKEFFKKSRLPQLYEQMRATSEFVYDALDRLMAFEKNGEKVVYHYDENNRRLSKTYYGVDGNNNWTEQKTIRYLYQGQNEIGSVNEGGEIR